MSCAALASMASDTLGIASTATVLATAASSATLAVGGGVEADGLQPFAELFQALYGRVGGLAVPDGSQAGDELVEIT